MKPVDRITIIRPDGAQTTVPIDPFRHAIEHSHKIIDQFKAFEVNVFSILGMRNLSAFIGELYAASVIAVSDKQFIKNPHQDGYPDLLLMDTMGEKLWHTLQYRLREKSPFSPFGSGGIEIKATCGSVPTPAQCTQRGCVKPDIGDQRIQVMRGYDWKAHHRETNNLLGLLWDFVDGVPRIAGVFYSGALREEHWGKIVHPKEGGGRTTSVSIMTRPGVKEMYQGWLFVIADERYTRFLDAHNQSTQLTEALRKAQGKG